MISNAAAVKAFKQRDALKAAKTAALRDLRIAERTYEKAERLLHLSESVTHVVRGVALAVAGGTVEAVSHDNRRAARWYPNAHNEGKTFGLTTWENPFGRQGEQWHGADWPSEKAAKDAAFGWVIDSTAPVKPAIAA